MLLCQCFYITGCSVWYFQSAWLMEKKKSRGWELRRDKRNKHFRCVVSCITPIMGTAWRRPAIRSVSVFLTRVTNGKWLRILRTQIPTADLFGTKIQWINIIQLAGHKWTLWRFRIKMNFYSSRQASGLFKVLAPHNAVFNVITCPWWETGWN